MTQRSAPFVFSALFWLVAVPAALAQQVVPVSGTCGAQTVELLSDPRPEPEWDVASLLVAGTDTELIIRNDDALDAARLAAIRVLAKEIFAETLYDESGAARTSAGSLGQMIAAGTLAGAELDLFDELFDPLYDPTVEPIVGSQAAARVELVDASAGGAHVAYLYVYDAQQLALRKALLGALETTVWLGDLVHSSDGTSKSMNVSGHDNRFHGRVRSAGGLRIGGYGQTFRAPVYWANGLIRLTSSAAAFDCLPLQESSPVLAAPVRSPSWYEAQPGSLVFAGDVVLLDDGNGGLLVSDGVQSWPAEGRVVRSGGAISVEGSQPLTGSVTLIAAGEISFAADASLLRAAAGELLAWSTAGDVTVGGSANVLTGALRAADHIRIGGSLNELTGQLRCASFVVTGGENVLSDGAH